MAPSIQRLALARMVAEFDEVIAIGEYLAANEIGLYKNIREHPSVILSIIADGQGDYHEHSIRLIY